MDKNNFLSDLMYAIKSTEQVTMQTEECNALQRTREFFLQTL